MINSIIDADVLPSASHDHKPMLSEVVFRPMLFSTPMVLAILNGTKTQTRRLVKKQPINYNEKSFIDRCNFRNWNWCLKHKVGQNPDRFEITDLMKCAINIGNTIWVRETWIDGPNYPALAEQYYYKASVSTQFMEEWKGCFKPSLFMPKSVCRLFLEVTNVRVERLNDISENDAEKEGVNIIGYNCYENYLVNKDWYYGGMNQKNYHMIQDPIGSYASLWDSINGKGSWSENPFVWVYDFKLVERPQGFR